MCGRTILLVEDELLIRTVMADVLGDAGYIVTEASDGDESLVILAEKDFDLLVTDVKMPGAVDGLQLAAHWKTRFPTRPVLISSAHLRADQLHLSDELITKPFSDAELLRKVARLIGSPSPSETSGAAA